jgi:hypothetical protein
MPPSAFASALIFAALSTSIFSAAAAAAAAASAFTACTCSLADATALAAAAAASSRADNARAFETSSCRIYIRSMKKKCYNKSIA